MINEEWNKYKDLEYYPDRVCRCGCGGRIKVRLSHKYNGICEFIKGHNRRGTHHTKETKEKQRRANNRKGKPNPKNSAHMKENWRNSKYKEMQSTVRRGHWTGNKNPMRCPEIAVKRRGYENPAKRPEVRAKIRASKLGKPRPDMLGENHPNWQGGISSIDYSSEFDEKFKKRIRERDHNTCQLCGRTKEEESKNLVVHHINHDKMNDCSDECDFITLCRSCNRIVENKCNREYYEGFFMERNLKFQSLELLLVTIE